MLMVANFAPDRPEVPLDDPNGVAEFQLPREESESSAPRETPASSFLRRPVESGSRVGLPMVTNFVQCQLESSPVDPNTST